MALRNAGLSSSGRVRAAGFQHYAPRSCFVHVALNHPRMNTSPTIQCHATSSDTPTPSTSGAQASQDPELNKQQEVLEEGEEYEEYEEDEEELEDYEPVDLDESHSMYQPVLGDEEDPPGHQSGYVAIIGRPNAGKSTLINAVIGQKLSIVTYKAQTTRHRIVGIDSAEEYQMILFDTPGIIDKKRDKLEERMMAAVVGSIKDSDAIIAVVDCNDDPKNALGMFQPGPNWDGPPMAVLLNKTDLLTPDEVEKLAEWYRTHCNAKAVFIGSALNNSGIDSLKKWAIEQLPEGPTLYSKSLVSEQPERFFVSELIREKIFLNYEKEIPYSTQVNIVEYLEQSDGAPDRVRAEILVMKESQMAIIIGKEGSKIKQLTQQAKKDIEAFLGRRVALDLKVAVAKNWRDDKNALSRYGYFDALLI